MNLYKQILRATQPTRRQVRQDLDAYLAGFFDGEGHVTISKHPERWTCHVEIGATQICREPLELLVRAYGGSIHKKATPKVIGKKPYRQCYAWRCRGREAMFAIYRMLPWLIVKLPKARAALIVLQNRPLNMVGGQISSRQKTAISRALDGLKIVNRQD